MVEYSVLAKKIKTEFKIQIWKKMKFEFSNQINSDLLGIANEPQLSRPTRDKFEIWNLKFENGNSNFCVSYTNSYWKLLIQILHSICNQCNVTSEITTLLILLSKYS